MNNNLWTINIRFVSQEKLLSWHDEFCKPENRKQDTLPGIDYSYHEIYAEMLRRDREENQDVQP